MELPLTNIEKFKKVKFTNGNFDTPFEFKEYFYVQNGTDCRETLHGNYKNEYEIEEGIQIKWGNNSFDLHFTNDNYIIVTNKIRE